MSTRSSPSFWSPLFLVCAGVLLAAAIGLHPALAALIDHYAKETIDLRRPLQEIDLWRIPSFQKLPSDDLLAVVGIEELGTADWIHYRFESRKAPLSGNLELLVTYYSDPRDNIPHTPEVCYRQGGAVVESIETVVVETPKLAPEIPSVEARLLEIDRGSYRTTVMYVICCNGKMYSGRESARWAIMMPGDKRVYFSKVEAIAHRGSNEDRRRSVEQCEQLLREALYACITEHFPRREDVER